MTNGSKKRFPTRKGKDSAALNLKGREVKPKSIGPNKGLIKAQVKRAKEIAQSEFENTRAEIYELDENMDRTQQDGQLEDLLGQCKNQMELLDQSASKRISDIGGTTTKLLSKMDKEVSSLDDGDETELKGFAEDLEAKAKKLVR